MNCGPFLAGFPAHLASEAPRRVINEVHPFTTGVASRRPALGFRVEPTAPTLARLFGYAHAAVVDIAVGILDLFRDVSEHVIKFPGVGSLACHRMGSIAVGAKNRAVLQTILR